VQKNFKVLDIGSERLNGFDRDSCCLEKKRNDKKRALGVRASRASPPRIYEPYLVYVHVSMTPMRIFRVNGF